MAFIKAEIDAGRQFPSQGAIAQHMGWRNATSAGDALFKLCSYDRVLARVNGVYQIKDA